MKEKKSLLTKRRIRIKKLMRYHKYPALFLSLFIILYALSGIVLNHRTLFAPFSVDRDYLGNNYQYYNWNMSSLKSVIEVDSNTNLLYGNIGIWNADSNFNIQGRFDNGFPETVDQRKIFKIFKSAEGTLFAGSLFGLHYLDAESQKWQMLDLPAEEARIYSILQNEEGLFVMSRNHIFKTTDHKPPFNFEIIPVMEPLNYDHKIGLFQTFWQIHNGDIFGMVGRLVMDFVALIIIILTLTGIYHWLAPRRIKKRRRTNKKFENITKGKRLSKLFHNKLGNWILILLILSTLTGMFLRPPLLISIAMFKVPKIPFTNLNSENPWNDRYRALIYDESKGIYLIGTTEGIYAVDKEFKKQPFLFNHQPPISVMGINELSKLNDKEYLVGSFLGLFKWNPWDGITTNYISGKSGVIWDPNAIPLGDVMVGGYYKKENGKEYYFDFNHGVTNIHHRDYFPKMSNKIIDQSPMSLWNFSQEIHTGRLYRFLFGKFYILFIPLSGIIILIILVVGWRLYKKVYNKPRN